MESNDQTSAEKVAELLNTVAFQSSEKDRVQTLSKVQELIIHYNPTILDSFFEDVVFFQTDRNADVRKFVVGFIEDACKKDPAMLPKLVSNIEMLLADDVIAVVKRVIQAAAQLHKFTLSWISSMRQTSSEQEQTWDVISRLKRSIVAMIDHDNDGVRTQAIKFIESVILVQTYTEPDSIQRSGDLCLDQIPLTLKIARPRKLEEESREILSKLIAFQGSLHISSVNLMTCMSSLSLIARARPQFMSKVIEAFEILHANLPPTLTKSQVNSVRKHLKIQLVNLLRHTASFDNHENILAMLSDLGVTANEVSKAMPGEDELRTRVKRIKPIVEEDEDVKSSIHESPKKKLCLPKDVAKESFLEDRQEDTKNDSKTAVDITFKWLVDKLTIENVANLVMVTMINLPDKIPSLFAASYSPVTAAGTAQQIQFVGRLLSSQLTAAGLGPGAEKLTMEEEKAKKKKKSDDDSDEEDLLPSNKIQRIIGRNIGLGKQLFEKPSLIPAGIAGRPLWQKTKFVKLSEVTKELRSSENKNLQLCLLKRILRTNKARLHGGAQKNRLKIISMFATISSIEEMNELESFIFEDLASNMELLQSWIYAQHAACQDFYQVSSLLRKSSELVLSYDMLFVQILKHMIALPQNKERDELIDRFVLECPKVPESALDLLKKSGCPAEENASHTTNLLKELAVWRPSISSTCVDILCLLAAHNLIGVREHAIKMVMYLYETKKTAKNQMEKIAKNNLCLLSFEKPNDAFYKSYLGRSETPPTEWTEEAVRAALFLALVLLPHCQELIHDLAMVYVKTVNEAKRTILRYLEAPVAQMGMDSPILLSLVQECPKGSETLITRIIHILTEKAPPSPELVSHVRELYNKRVSDVRFLIPVLTGLSKKEVVAVLPKLIKLNPHVVKEVFNRLWGVTLDKGTSPLTPVELLVALHLIDTDKFDIKTIIKATGLCFAERSIYTHEVLAIVLQQLLEQAALPTLFMRTVIQTLTHHPKLLPFIMNILQRLIVKQVWNQRKAWEGFIKCCQRAVPQSFTVLLQLPPTQLVDLFKEAPDLKEFLINHTNSLTESQRSHIPSSIMDVISTDSSEWAAVKIEKEDEEYSITNHNSDHVQPVTLE